MRPFPTCRESVGMSAPKHLVRCNMGQRQTRETRRGGDHASCGRAPRFYPKHDRQSAYEFEAGQSLRQITNFRIGHDTAGEEGRANQRIRCCDERDLRNFRERSAATPYYCDSKNAEHHEFVTINGDFPRRLKWILENGPDQRVDTATVDCVNDRERLRGVEIDRPTIARVRISPHCDRSFERVNKERLHRVRTAPLCHKRCEDVVDLTWHRMSIQS